MVQVIKFGFFTDTHARFDSPEERTDNFLNSLLLKLEEVGQIFKDQKVDYVLFGGDLYDSDSVAKSVISSVQTELRSWQFPIIGIVGSHDYFGYQMKTLKSTALGITESAGIINIVGGYGHPDSFDLDDGRSDPTRVKVIGMPHTYTFNDSKSNMFASAPEKGVVQIQLVHADLNDKPVPWRHILIEDGLTYSQLVISGHYHPGWNKPIIKKASSLFGEALHSVTYINPGSIARMKNTGVVRTPRVCIISVVGELFTTEFIDLKSAIPHPFKEKKTIVEDEEPMVDVNRFFELISTDKVEIVDVKGQIKLVAEEIKCGDDVLAEAMIYIDMANGAETLFIPYNKENRM